jgi:hypothetical protein
MRKPGYPMKHVLRISLALILATSIMACEPTVPANSRENKTVEELQDFFSGAPGGALAGGTGGSGGSFAGIPKTGGGAPAVSASGGTVAAPVRNDPTMDWADPCAQNLDELVSTLLLYYAEHNALPPSLEQIPKESITGTPISFSCPDCGKKYLYYPQGLKPPSEFLYQRADGAFQEGSKLVLCDAAAAHAVGQRGAEGGGTKRAVRLGIVVEMPQPTRAVPNPSVQMYIVPVDLEVLNRYLRTNNMPPLAQ